MTVRVQKLFILFLGWGRLVTTVTSTVLCVPQSTIQTILIVMIGQHQEQSKTKVRIFAILLLVLEVALMFIYGFASEFDITTTSFPTSIDNSRAIIYYTISAILPILGWGLIIVYSENSAVSGLMSTLLSAGLFVQLAPPVMAFASYLWNGTWAGRFPISLFLEQQVMFGLTSFLVCLCFLAGRLGFAELIIANIVFIFGWSANFYLIFWLKTTKFAGEIQNSDAIGSNYVYFFAGVVGLIVSLVLGFKPGRQGSFSGSRQSAIIGLIGTGFAFAAAPFSGFFTVNNAGLYQQPLNVYFTMTASVIMTYASSAIFGNYRVGVRQSLVGVLSGVAMIGAVAGYVDNIGACITLGIIAGFISGVWLRVVHPRLNRSVKYDQLGLIGPILINSFLGALFIGPIVFAAYKREAIIPNSLNTLITTDRSSTYYLSIFGITLALAILTGILMALLIYIFRNPEDDHHFTKLVSSDFGLYVQGAQTEEQGKRYQRNPGQSANEIKNNEKF